MSLFPESTGGKLVFPPKMGEKKTFSLVGELQRIKTDRESKLNYQDKNKKDMGYHDIVPVVTEVQNEETGQVEEIEIDMLLGTWSLYFALKEAYDKQGIDIGDTIEIDHPSSGVYNIKKVN